MWTLAGIGGVVLLAAMPCFFLGVLGLMGVVADVGPAENREIGWQFLGIGVIPLVIGAGLLIAARLVRRR